MTERFLKRKQLELRKPGRAIERCRLEHDQAFKRRGIYSLIDRSRLMGDPFHSTVMVFRRRVGGVSSLDSLTVYHAGAGLLSTVA